MAEKRVSSYEKAMVELETILDKLSENSLSLDESIKLYAKAAQLIQTSHEALEKAAVQVAEIDEKLHEMRGANDI